MSFVPRILSEAQDPQAFFQTVPPGSFPASLPAPQSLLKCIFMHSEWLVTFLSAWHKPRVIWKKGISIEELLYQIGLWAYHQSLPLIVD